MSIIKVKTGGITADAITSTEIADNAVVTAAINADAVTDAKIADDVVGTEHLTANEVDTTALGADAVTAAQIADNAISEEHLDVTSITGHTAETSIADGDLVLIHDASASALRKMTKANFVSGIGGAMTPLVEAQRRSSNQTISATTYTKIVFNTEHIDTGSIYNNSTGVVTIADAGKYFVGVNVDVRELSGAAEYAAIQINNTSRGLSDVTGAIVSGHGNGGYDFYQLNCQHIKSYSANDTIAIWIYGTEEVKVCEPNTNLTIFKIIE